MKTIELWFYDALAARKHGKKLDWIDAVILLRSSLTHAELCFADRQRAFFSSTTAQGANGCRFKFGVDKNPERWQVITLNVATEQETRVWTTACSLAGVPTNQLEWLGFLKEHNRQFIYQGDGHKKYDASGLLSFALRKSGKWWLDGLRSVLWCWTKLRPFMPDAEDMWCSEAVAVALKAGGFVFDRTEISPQELYEQVCSMKGETK